MLPSLLFASGVLFLPSRPQTLISTRQHREKSQSHIPCCGVQYRVQKHPASLQGQPGIGTAQTVQGLPCSISALFRRKLAHCLDPWLRLALGCRRRLRPSSSGSSLFDRMRRRPAGQQLKKHVCQSKRPRQNAVNSLAKTSRPRRRLQVFHLQRVPFFIKPPL